MKDISKTLASFKSDDSRFNPASYDNNRHGRFEEPTRDPDVWPPPPKDPDVWPAPTPVEHRYYFT